MNETHVDLFSGLGCWAIAARVNGLRTVAMCEIEPWLREGLHRMWKCPVHHDVKTFDAEAYRGTWLLTGSPPCQPASVAGKRRGKADDRWLWDETIAVCEVIQPSWFIFENPSGIDGVGLDGIISDLERIGYEVAALRIPACAVNSPQNRDRFWIVGNRTRKHDERQRESFIQEQRDESASRTVEDRTVGNGNGAGQQGCDVREVGRSSHGLPAKSTKGVTLANGDEQPGWARTGTPPWTQDVNNAWSDYEWISFNGAVYRTPVGLYSMADGVVAGIPKKFRSKLISALGNAIVWQVAAKLIKAIKANDPHHSRPTSR